MRTSRTRNLVLLPAGLLATATLCLCSWAQPPAVPSQPTPRPPTAGLLPPEPPPERAAPAGPPVRGPLLPAADASPTPPAAVADPAPQAGTTEHALEQLLKLRQQLGSPLEGTVLDGPTAEQEFRELLLGALQRGAASPASSEPPERAAPPSLPPRDGPTGPVAAAELRTAARAVQRHAEQLEPQLPARAARLRRLANRLRREAQEIDELRLE